ncbi:hypothetical protein PILCRDRAFT_135480 [Piloderma croceum F 1598]|uniref:Uncharacterized protein n=1 Tax=Piloderma croceum (strain F 1598) TaxID=765440 RepID=A0A0C3CPQ1_PILCF|nr:hypothetical protein PILCRDRAFT_135480 [Piloderma croceum F 1598]
MPALMRLVVFQNFNATSTILVQIYHFESITKHLDVVMHLYPYHPERRRGPTRRKWTIVVDRLRHLFTMGCGGLSEELALQRGRTLPNRVGTLSLHITVTEHSSLPAGCCICYRSSQTHPTVIITAIRGPGVWLRNRVMYTIVSSA